MATLTYTFVERCASGGHTALDVSFNGGANNRFVYVTDELRAPLSNLSSAERSELALLILKVHMAGKSRAQIVNEFQSGPVGITI
jgi:hypothetical protein